MTNEEFLRLYDNNEISTKVYYQKNEHEDGRWFSKEVAAFEYNGAYFLRINNAKRVFVHDRRGNRHWWTTSHSTLKEFQTREQANNYFKKAAHGLSRVR